MLVVVRTSQRQVSAWLEGKGGPAEVGPTSAAGWTALWWWEGPSDPAVLGELRCDFLVLVEDQDADEFMLLSGPRTAVPSRFAGNSTESAPEVAAQLCAMFGTDDDRPAVEQILRSASSTRDALEGVASVLELPEFVWGDFDASVVAIRANAHDVWLALAVAGPAYMSPELAGWTLVVPVRGEDVLDAHGLASVVSAVVGRKGLVLTCWRRGVQAGFTSHRKGEVEVVWTWNSPWVTVSADEIDIEREIGDFVRAHAREPHEAVDVRGMLRRRGSEPDPLTAFVSMLGIPAEVLSLLASPDTPFRERLELVEKRSVRRAWLGAWVRSLRTDTWSRHRGAAVAYATAATVAALVCVALAVSSIVDPVSWHEGPPRYWFWVLSVALVPAAVLRWRRLWRG
jgi:uncharacterized membrane protein YdcZ (DUF606 family)